MPPMFDKNSLWGGLNIQKRELYVKGTLAQDLGFVWGLFSGDSEDFRVMGVGAVSLGPSRSSSQFLSPNK